MLIYLKLNYLKMRKSMSSEILRLTTEIVVSHSAVTELTTEQLLGEIKDIYNALSSLEGGKGLEESVSEKAKESGGVKPSIPLKDIVKTKYVVCLEWGKKLKTLKRHLEKAHGLKPKEYCQKFDLDPKKYPLVCKDYSKTRSQMAKERGFGKEGGRKKQEGA
jgi:predicted transcriptional regulator